MSTECTQNKTMIDHLAIEFRSVNKNNFTKLIAEITEVVRLFEIKVSSKRPYASTTFKDGNLLYGDFKINGKLAVGAIKINHKELVLKLELSGAICMLIQTYENAFMPIYNFSIQHGGIIRRLDICFDDTSGKYNIRRTQQDFSSGKYQPTQGPKLTTKVLSSSAGTTKYIGSSSSFKFLRVYEKGKELKLPKEDPRYKNWTRHELVLKGQGKVLIPLKALLNSDGLFQASFPKAHRKMIKSTAPMNVRNELTTTKNLVGLFFKLTGCCF